MAIGVIPVILAMGRRQREEEEARRKADLARPRLPHLCYVREYGDAQPAPTPTRLPDRESTIQHPCGCVETRRIWRSEPFDIGQRLFSRRCGGLQDG